jgi:hypothetical protein
MLVWAMSSGILTATSEKRASGGRSGGSGRKQTEQTSEMLPAIYVAGRLFLPVGPHDVNVLLPQVGVLVALEGVEQDLADRVVEVANHARDEFLEDVLVGALALRPLVCCVVGEDLADRSLGWQVDEGEVLGHELPVVDEKGFEDVRDGNADFGARVEGLFLFTELH